MKEIIKFLGKKDDIVWIYPKTTISKDAIIHVEMGYQAIMMRNGEIDIPYFPGINKVFNEKQSRFSLLKNNKYINDCNIYFFNLTPDVNSREWGTKYPIKYFDKRYKMELTLGSHGTYKIYLHNPRLLLKSFKIDINTISSLESSIKEMVIARLTSTMTKVLMTGEFDLLSIHAYYDVITKKAEEIINEEFAEKGFSINDLSISYIAPVEEEQIKILKELQFKFQVFDTEIKMANKENILNKNQTINHELICSNCNSVITRDMKFCDNCGSNLKEFESGD